MAALVQITVNSYTYVHTVWIIMMQQNEYILCNNFMLGFLISMHFKKVMKLLCVLNILHYMTSLILQIDYKQLISAAPCMHEQHKNKKKLFTVSLYSALYHCYDFPREELVTEM